MFRLIPREKKFAIRLFAISSLQIVALQGLILAVLVNCTYNDVGRKDAREQFVGKWEITEAYKDNQLQQNWNGIVVEFDQENIKGAYKVPDSPSEQIWKKEGTWVKSDQPYVFIREDGLPITYAVANNQLELSFLIIEPGPICTENPCLPVVYGNWLLKLKKI